MRNVDYCERRKEKNRGDRSVEKISWTDTSTTDEEIIETVPERINQ